MMKLRVFFAVCLLIQGVCHGQHAGDVEFGYDVPAAPTGFVFDSSDFTSDGLRYFESEFEELDPFTPGDFSADEPGFTTNLGEGLRVNQGDQVWLNALDASSLSSFGQGYVNYYNPVADTLTAAGRLGIIDNSGATANLVLNGAGIESGLSNQFIGLGDSVGDVHDHVIVDLLDDGSAPLGAYGVLVQLQSDFSPADATMDLSSDPFWIVFNHGMSDSDFDTRALPSFGVSAVPEPGSFLVLGVAAVVGSSVRRRRVTA